MTPARYVELVAIPNIRRFLKARGDVGLAYTACIATYHVADHLAHAEGDSGISTVLDHLVGFCEPALRIVQGLCNGTKHRKPKPGVNPGDEAYVPQFGYGMHGAGFGQGRIGTDGLRIGDIEDGVFVDGSVQTVLLALQAFYPQHLGGVDLSFIDRMTRLSHDEAWRRREAGSDPDDRPIHAPSQKVGLVRID